MRTSLKVSGILGLMLALSACGGSSGGGGTQSANNAGCVGASCSRDESSPSAPLACGGTSNAACPQGYRCVDDPADRCDPTNGGTNCAGTCVLGEELPHCGAATDAPCPDGSICADDPTDSCDGGPAVDCPGVCRPPTQGECTADADCPQLEMPCSVCADGTASCPHSHCEDGQCTVDVKPCPEPHACGGIAGIQCGPGLECVDDPSDMCDPANGSADCPGICAPTNEAQCNTDADCPPLPAPCSVCADGSPACPQSVCNNGRCSVVVVACPVPPQCATDTDCKPGEVCLHLPGPFCDPTTSSGGCPSVCVPDMSPRRCGGSAGQTCPPGYECVPDANDSCDPATGMDCAGVCKPTDSEQCTTDADCPLLPGPCRPCADGSLACSRSACTDGHCGLVFSECLMPAGCTDNADWHLGENYLSYARTSPSSAGDNCRGICQPNGTAQCTTDADCKPVPGPCRPCADGSFACSRSACTDGHCGLVFSECPMPEGCTDDSDCKSGETCTFDASSCDPDSSGNCRGFCRPNGTPQCTADADCPRVPGPCRPCADGSLACSHPACTDGQCSLVFDECPAPAGCSSDSDCKPGESCAIDPSTGCDLTTSSPNCQGVCVPMRSPQCQTNDECVSIQAPCALCPDGSYACPRSECKDGMCTVVFDACRGPGFCGGVAGFPCPAGFTCVDDPNDECDPKNGGADCGGMCVREEEPPPCGGITGKPCPDGFQCADDPRDDCDPMTGADCPGICRPAPSPACTTDADCPVIGAPCRLCADGSAACPRSFCNGGKCQADFQTCAEAM